MTDSRDEPPAANGAFTYETDEERQRDRDFLVEQGWIKPGEADGWSDAGLEMVAEACGSGVPIEEFDEIPYGPLDEVMFEYGDRWDSMSGVERLIAAAPYLGGRYYRGDQLKRELAEKAPSVVEANPDAAEKLDRLLVRMDKVESRRVEWLWRDRIPLRAVTLLAGIGGLGKSQASLAIAGEATRGELTGHPEAVLLFTAEDDLEAVVRPRLEAAQADAALVFALRMNADLWLPDGIDELHELVRQTQARLIIFDPLLAYVAEETETHKERDVRVLIRRLHDVAAEFDAAVLAVMHFKKGAEADALYRVSGAAGFGNAARSVLAAARDPNDETRRVLVHVKNNYGVEKPAIRFEVRQFGESSAVVFGAEDVSLTQREVFGQTPGPEPDAQDEAVEFLLSELADGPKSAKDVVADAKAAGVTEATLRRAKKRLQIKPAAVRGDDNKITGWVWALPEEEGPSETPDS